MVALLLVVLVLLVGGGAAAGLLDRGRREPVTETVELRFGPDVSEDAVWGVLGGMSGLPLRTQVVLEIVSDADGMCHYLSAGHGTIEIIRAHLRGLLPGVRLEPVESKPERSWRVAVRVQRPNMRRVNRLLRPQPRQ
jgi:hypothetical protein